MSSQPLTSIKRRMRSVVDRIALPYVDQVAERIGTPRGQPGDASEAVAHDATDVPQHGTSDYFHNANHELRTLELERVPKGARRALSVGAQGRWYFDWFERSVGTLDEHVGVEAFEPMPDDLPPYVRWVADTADKMIGVADGSVDLVFAGQTSEHLWAHELVGFLCESHRVLVEDGILALDSPNRLITEHLIWSHGGHTIELSAAEMSTLLDLAGFTVLSVSGVWSCRVDGRILQLEESITDAAVFARRCANGREAPDDCFVWWINARRNSVAPQVEALTREVARLFDAHWARRVGRGLMPPPGAGDLTIARGTRGVIGETLPFPLHEGTWQVAITLSAGAWSDLQGFVCRIMAPGDHLIHRLDAQDAVVDGARATWTISQPYLLFALILELSVSSLSADVAIGSLDVRPT